MKNIEWIFGGIGVLFLSYLINFLFKRKKQNALIPLESPRNSNVNAITVNNNIMSPISTHAAEKSNNFLNIDSAAKTRIRVLFIDDDTRFKVVEILKKTGWVHTKNREDVLDLEDSDILEANVIFVDINGVGSTLFKDQGLGLAVNLKRKYSAKKIVIYSAETQGDMFNKALREVDACLPKNAEPYEFISLLESFANELLSK